MKIVLWKLTNASKEKVKRTLESIGSSMDIEDVHMTISYINENVQWMNYFKSNLVKTMDLEVWENTERGGKSLVLLLASDEAIMRHREIEQTCKASYPFKNYRPHITLDYNWNGTPEDTNRYDNIPLTLSFDQEICTDYNPPVVDKK